MEPNNITQQQERSAEQQLGDLQKEQTTSFVQQRLLAAPQEMIETAIQYVKNGLSVMPVGKNKKPTLDHWKPFQLKCAEVGELMKWWSNTSHSIAIICGQVSGSLEVIDFDEKYNIDPVSVFEQWKNLVDCELPGLVDTLVMQTTIGKGYHLLYRCKIIQRNQKLAQRATTKAEVDKDPDLKSLTLIETRGEGGYFLSFPSNGYSVFNGSLLAVPEITEAQREIFLSCARALNQYIAPKSIVAPKESNPSGNRPGDVYNEKGDHKLLLEQHGWHYVSDNPMQEFWRRPGKTEGVSASYLKEKGLLYVFSSNAGPLDSERAYNKFSLYTYLEADGDFKKAAKQLAEEDYGELSTGGDDSILYQKVEDHLNEHYQLRRNAVTTHVEICKKDEKSFHVVEDIQLNSLHRELLKAKLPIGIDALNRELYSDFVEEYDPFLQYFEGLSEWDGKKDFVEELAKSITLKAGSDPTEFRESLERWLIGMVACATEPTAINQTAIILVGEQAIAKGRWLGRLVPEELSKYQFIGTIDPENKDTQIYLAECIQINLDELENLKKSEIGTLKSMMTLPRIKVRRPYDRLPKDLIRRASFVGSINQTEFLNDPTGSRRFLTFEIESLNLGSMPDMDLVMAQVYTLFKEGKRWWFDEAEIAAINERNKRFSICGYEEELLLELVPAAVNTESWWTEWVTATQIAERIKYRRPDFRVDKGSVQEVGRGLVKNGYKSKRTNSGKRYAIK